MNQSCLEFILEVNGQRLNEILGKGIHFNWTSFPKLDVGCELSYFSDAFWNQEQLLQFFENLFLLNAVSDLIKDIKTSFDPEKNSFDGKYFVNTEEYVFCLESYCEASSNQLVKMEILFDYTDIDYGQIDEETLAEYEEIRKQYGIYPFE